MAPKKSTTGAADAADGPNLAALKKAQEEAQKLLEEKIARQLQAAADQRKADLQAEMKQAEVTRQAEMKQAEVTRQAEMKQAEAARQAERKADNDVRKTDLQAMEARMADMT